MIVATCAAQGPRQLASRPLGYHGLGDVFVFIFFGLVGVAGTYYVQTHELTAQALAWRTADHLVRNWKTIAG